MELGHTNLQKLMLTLYKNLSFVSNKTRCFRLLLEKEKILKRHIHVSL